MFKITVTIDDKRLPDVLWALDGKIVGQPTIAPHKNGAIQAAKTKAPQKPRKPMPPGTSYYEQLRARIIQEGLTEVSARQLDGFIKDMGAHPMTVYPCLTKAKELRFLKGPISGSRKNRIFTVNSAQGA